MITRRNNLHFLILLINFSILQICRMEHQALFQKGLHCKGDANYSLNTADTVVDRLTCLVKCLVDNNCSHADLLQTSAEKPKDNFVCELYEEFSVHECTVLKVGIFDRFFKVKELLKCTKK